MNVAAMAFVVGLALLACPRVEASPRETLRERLAERIQGRTPDTPQPGTTIPYGSDPLQRLDVWPAQGRQPALLVMFVHGGGWKRGSKDSATSRWAPTYFPRQGYVYAATVEQQGEDVALALEAAGTAVEFGSFPGTGLRGHAQINRELGNPDYVATAVVNAWLEKLIGR